MSIKTDLFKNHPLPASFPEESYLSTIEINAKDIGSSLSEIEKYRTSMTPKQKELAWKIAKVSLVLMFGLAGCIIPAVLSAQAAYSLCFISLIAMVAAPLFKVVLADYKDDWKSPKYIEKLRKEFKDYNDQRLFFVTRTDRLEKMINYDLLNTHGLKEEDKVIVYRKYKWLTDLEKTDRFKDRESYYLNFRYRPKELTKAFYAPMDDLLKQLVGS